MVAEAVAAEEGGATGYDVKKDRQKSKEISDGLILEVEKNKAMITAPRGNQSSTGVPTEPIADPSSIDNRYFLSTCHLDDAIKEKN